MRTSIFHSFPARLGALGWLSSIGMKIQSFSGGGGEARIHAGKRNEPANISTRGPAGLTVLSKPSPLLNFHPAVASNLAHLDNRDKHPP
jgi:hypothetical protein